MKLITTAYMASVLFSYMSTNLLFYLLFCVMLVSTCPPLSKHFILWLEWHVCYNEDTFF